MKSFFKTFFVFSTLIVFSLAFIPKALSEDTKYLPGSTCPVPEDPSLTSYCGAVRAAMPQQQITQLGTEVYKPGVGLEGVTLCLYECNGDATIEGETTTCKENGNLVHLFSETYTNQDGLFNITARKVGGAEIRYFVFLCGPKLGGILEIPSYLDNTTLTQYVDCPTNLPPMPCPETLEYVDRDECLACSMGTEQENEDWDWENVDNMPALTNEVFFENNPPQAELNFDLNLENADPRFSLPDKHLDSLQGNNHTPTPQEGAFWSKDCFLRYENKPDIQRMCMGTDIHTSVYAPSLPKVEMNPNFRKDTFGDTDEAKLAYRQYIVEYEEGLYTRADLLVANRLPNIPPRNTLLFYKEFTARQDINEYIQNPAKPAQYLHTNFGNCVGSVFLRKDMEEKEDALANCEVFRDCNLLINPESPDGNYRNSYTTNGYSKKLGSPFLLQMKFKQWVDQDKEVCQLDDSGENKVKIKDIEKPWEPDGSGRLGKEYFNYDFLFSLGARGETAKAGFGIEPYNDSFYTQNPDAVPFEPTWEAGGVAQLAAGSPVFSATENQNNSLVAAGLLSSTTEDPYALTNMFMSPTTDSKQMLRYISGASKISDISVPMKLCTMSNVNFEPDFPVRYDEEKKNVAQDASVLKNKSEGNKHHYPEAENFWSKLGVLSNILKPIINLASRVFGFDISQEIDNTETAVSALYFTSAALARDDALKNLKEVQGIYGNTVYNGYLTTTYGDGITDFDKDTFFDTSGLELDENYGKPRTLQTFYDDKFGDSLVNPDPIDSLLTTYEFSEENFMEMFPLPSVKTGWLMPEEWGGTDKGGEEIAGGAATIATIPDCYPWNAVERRETCNDNHGAYKETDDISRTCRVDKCWKTTTTKTCGCRYQGGGKFNLVNCRESVNLSQEECSGYNDTDKSLRYVCAEGQTTCRPQSGKIDQKDESDCIEETYKGLIESKKPSCSIGDFANSPNSWNYVPQLSTEPINTTSGLRVGAAVDVSITFDTPSCAMSFAGPYACYGNLEKDSDLLIKQQKVRSEDSYVGNTTRVMDAVPMDGILYSEATSSKFWMSPIRAQETWVAGAEVKTTSSINSVDPENQRTTGKSLIKGFGSGAAAPIKATWATPISFDPSPDYSPIEYGCNNEDLGSVGSWGCNFEGIPDPEIIDIKSLYINPACSLNPSPKCKELIFGNTDIGFSDTFISIISAAATAYELPASILLAYMQEIGTLQEYSYYWSKEASEYLWLYSAPWYGSFLECDNMARGAQGPFDWRKGDTDSDRPGGFELTLKNTNVANVIDNLSKGRGLDYLNEDEFGTLRRCNFLDAAYAAATTLASNIDGGSCSLDWSLAQMSILDMTFGTDRRGSYATATTNPQVKEVYNACKY